MKIHLNDINLRCHQTDMSTQRNITNKPNVQLALETVKEMRDGNPKILQNLTVRIENSRFSLSLKDIQSLHSVLVSQQKEM